MYLRPLEGLSPARGDVLTIELESGTAPVSRVLYRLAPAEMAELKEHMEDLSNKRFIRLRNSLWGVPVLFVKKKKCWEFQALHRLHRLEHGNHHIDELLN